jgi:CD109 antigen
MAIMEVTLPSGYTVDSDSLPSIREYPAVRRVESHDGNTNLVIYFDKVINSSEIYRHKHAIEI